MVAVIDGGCCFAVVAIVVFWGCCLNNQKHLSIKPVHDDSIMRKTRRHNLKSKSVVTVAAFAVVVVVAAVVVAVVVAVAVAVVVAVVVAAAIAVVAIAGVASC